MTENFFLHFKNWLKTFWQLKFIVVDIREITPTSSIQRNAFYFLILMTRLLQTILITMLMVKLILFALYCTVGPQLVNRLTESIRRKVSRHPLSFDRGPKMNTRLSKKGVKPTMIEFQKPVQLVEKPATNSVQPLFPNRLQTTHEQEVQQTSLDIRIHLLDLRVF